MAEQNDPTFRSGEYRKYLPDLNIPRFQMMKQQNAHEYANDFKTKRVPPWLYALYEHWQTLLAEPFKGVTNDGKVREGLFELQDEGIDIDAIVSATDALLAQLTEEQRTATLYHIDSPEWRTWSNPEFLLFPKGLRLDEISEAQRNGVLAVLRATLSPEGYEKAVAAMRINGFLGTLVDGSGVCNEHSYNFALFGTPGAARPWGWTFYGHHLCLNAFLHRTQLVLSPWFTGAEPNEIDAGPHAGTRILVREEALGLQLMQGLPRPLQQAARRYARPVDPAMPPGRWNRDDQRHVCGAARDNRVVPYEGVPVAAMPAAQQALVRALLAEFFVYLPARARQRRVDQAMAHAAETFFCWIGGFGPDDPFYYRLQSPVVLVEFDHHSGVFLTNAEPAKFHVHTLLRTPNGGDYGTALKKLVEPVEQMFVWEPEE